MGDFVTEENEDNLLFSRLVSLLQEFVGFDSSISVKNGVFPGEDVALWLRKQGERLGYEVLDVPRGLLSDPLGSGSVSTFPVVLVRRSVSGVSSPRVLFLGHFDVVPVTVEERGEWVVDPFSGVVRDGKLFGRGSFDMKGSDIAFLLAFADPFVVERGTVVLAFSGDEEIGSKGSMEPILQVLRENDLFPDFVINGEPSSVPVIVTKRRAATLIEMEFPLLPRRVRGVVSTLEFHSVQGSGKTSLHNAYFTFGADIHAMYAAAKTCGGSEIVSLESSSTQPNSIPLRVRVKCIEPGNVGDGEEVTVFDGLKLLLQGLTPLPSVCWGLDPSEFGYSIGPNVLTIDKEKGVGRLIFDFRTMFSGVDGHEVIVEKLHEHFSKFFNGDDLSFRFLLKGDPMFEIEGTDSLVHALRVAAEEYGFPIVKVGEKLGGSSDSRFFPSLGVPAAELGPLGANAHGINEYVDLESLQKLVFIYRRAFELLGRGK